MLKLSFRSVGQVLSMVALVASAGALRGASAETYLAPGFTCAREEFAAPPAMVNGVFQGTLVSQCEVIGSKGGGLAALDRYLVAKTLKDAQTVHGGPFEATLSGLKAVRYEVTVADDDSKIRQDALVGFDAATQRLAYGTFSKAIQPSGVLQKLDIQVDFSLPTHKTVSAVGPYRVRYAITLHLKKPIRFIPDGAFQTEAEKRARKTFVERQNASLSQMVDQL
jgi:hypothetical protein